MKKLFVTMVLASFLLVPVMAGGQTGDRTAGLPRVQQTLIPEGFFAIKLADAFKLDPAKTEPEAETTLTSLGIAPKNGWIADYPVTPDVLIELQNAVGTATDSGKLSMERDEAMKTVQDVALDLGLPIVTAGGQGGQTTSAEGDGEYTDSSEITNYYDEEGPPVITYYPPPPDYNYLYAWVPSPFWCAGFFFPGFFVLNDFDIIVVLDHHGHHHHHHGITNHIIDPKTHQVARIDPITRSIGRNVGSTANLTQRGFNTNRAQNGASAIFNQSLQRTKAPMSPRANATTSPSATGRSAGGTGAGPETGFFSRPQAPANHEAPLRMQASPGRSFSPPSTSGQSSFGGHSFEGYHGGSGSFGGGMAGRGFGGGGCRGRC